MIWYSGEKKKISDNWTYQAKVVLIWHEIVWWTALWVGRKAFAWRYIKYARNLYLAFLFAHFLSSFGKVQARNEHIHCCKSTFSKKKKIKRTLFQYKCVAINSFLFPYQKSFNVWLTKVARLRWLDIRLVPSFFCVFMELGSVSVHKHTRKNLTNIQPSWPHVWSIIHRYCKYIITLLSVGFVLYFKNKPILGYCVDSGFKEDVFEFFFQASTVIVDAREQGTKEHASVRQ